MMVSGIPRAARPISPNCGDFRRRAGDDCAAAAVIRAVMTAAAHSINQRSAGVGGGSLGVPDPTRPQQHAVTTA